MFTNPQEDKYIYIDGGRRVTVCYFDGPRTRHFSYSRLGRMGVDFFNPLFPSYALPISGNSITIAVIRHPRASSLEPGQEAAAAFARSQKKTNETTLQIGIRTRHSRGG